MPSFDEMMSKTHTVLLAAKTVSKTQKGLSLRNGQKPVRECFAAKRCRKPKMHLAANVSSVNPFRVRYSVCRVCTLTSVFDLLWVYIPFWLYIPFWPLWPPISCLHVHAPLYGFSAYVYVHPLMGFIGHFEDEWSLMGFSCRFADEWSLMGFSYRFVVSDAIWDFQFVSQRWTPFEFWGSFAAFRPLRVCLTVWVFIYLFIYLFLYSLIYLNIYLFVYFLCF